MRRLADESGETVNLMVRAPQGAEAVAQADGRHVLGVSNWVGREVPDHCSAAGKIFLAFGASALPPGRSSGSPRGRSCTATTRARAGGGPPAGFAADRRRARDGAHGGGRTDPRRGRLGRRRPVGRRSHGAPWARGSPSSAAWRSSRPTASRPSSATGRLADLLDPRGAADDAGDLGPARPRRARVRLTTPRRRRCGPPRRAESRGRPRACRCRCSGPRRRASRCRTGTRRRVSRRRSRPPRARAPR